MKKSLILFIVTCGLVAGALVYLHQRKSPASSAPTVETAATQFPQQTPPEQNPVPALKAPLDSNATTAPTPAPVAPATAAEAKTNDSTNSISKTVDALLSAREQKQALFDQLRTNGQLDAVIAELQQRAAASPGDAGIPTTLGEALLNKLRGLAESHTGDYNEMGILAMQADQNFNAALKIDPQNWEAQFVKSSSMYYWPASLQMDNQVVQQLSKLIDQQETMPSRTEFAQTYAVLGDEYQKIGKTQEAIATWQLGAQKFPGDPTFQKKIATASQSQISGQ